MDKDGSFDRTPDRDDFFEYIFLLRCMKEMEMGRMVGVRSLGLASPATRATMTARGTP